MLLEIEGEHYHAARRPFERLGILQQILVNEVATVLDQQVGESEAELNLRDELEEWQIEVTPHAQLQRQVINPKRAKCVICSVNSLSYASFVLSCEDIDRIREKYYGS